VREVTRIRQRNNFGLEGKLGAEFCRRACPLRHVILGEDFMILRLTTVHENARSALECGGLTPPFFEVHTGPMAGPHSRQEAWRACFQSRGPVPGWGAGLLGALGGINRIRTRRHQAAALQGAFGAAICRAVFYSGELPPI